MSIEHMLIRIGCACPVNEAGDHLPTCEAYIRWKRSAPLTLAVAIAAESGAPVHLQADVARAIIQATERGLLRFP